ncbi:MAG TPA: NAD(P)-dependent oxidoreductase [Chthoniobacterales bacterium]|jgi:3-hydroxyisobutyrate dehydrogenase-like beta-hydroxyacid dehydrogenase|nr:NAD(P)-dependent oxidoreductase [Chthoniobacterales bacterium]
MPVKKQAIGVIGLGIIGSRVAANLRRAGYDVWVWSRSPKSEPNFLSSAAEVAETADLLLVFVSDGPALIEVMRSMAPALAARHLIVNHSTIAPEEARQASEIAAASSAGFLDAPFTGSRDAAAAGQLVYYVSGASEWIERARPVLSASAKSIIEIGSEIGQASLVKIATNLIAAATVEALAEAVALVDANGISSGKFLEAFAEHGTRSGIADMKLPGMITGDFEPRFALKHMFKDIQLALQAGQAADIDLPAAAATAGALMAGIQRGWADLDFSAVAQHYAFPGREPLVTNALASAAGDPGPKPKRFSLFGGTREP